MRNTSLISTIKHFLTLKRHRPRRPQSPAASSGLAPSPKRGFSAPSAPAALSSDAPPAALRLAQRSAAPPRPRSHPRRASPGTLRAPPRPSAQADLPRGMLRFAEGRKEGRAVEGRSPTGAIPCLRHSRTAPHRLAPRIPRRTAGGKCDPPPYRGQTLPGDPRNDPQAGRVGARDSQKEKNPERGMERGEDVPPRRSPAAPALPAQRRGAMRSAPAGAAHAPRPSPLTSSQGQLGGPAAHRHPRLR